MCGRFALPIPAKSLAEHFSSNEFPGYEPRYNIAPTQYIPGIIKDQASGERLMKPFHWGLIPSWAKDRKIGTKLINARAETIAEKPSFRSAFMKRRCLVPASGFYEWKKLEHGKQPYYIRMLDEKPFAFAGLWEQWRGEPEGPVDSCTIITTEPNELLRQLHNRMPVILNPGDYDDWLDPDNNDKSALQHLLKPYPPGLMTSFPVSRHVNKPVNNDPACIQPVE